MYLRVVTDLKFSLYCLRYFLVYEFSRFVTLCPDVTCTGSIWHYPTADVKKGLILGLVHLVQDLISLEDEK